MISMKANKGKKEKQQSNEYPCKTFARRLSYVMFIRDTSNEQLARHLHLSTSTISGYRTGRRAPSIDDLVRIAVFLHVSTDYLLGLQNDP
jgi:transcriptional regulator with XRE-family HTH domain